MTFYTYIYLDPSRNEEPFYVGKGSDWRFLTHLTGATNKHLRNRIKAMKSLDVTPTIEIVNCVSEQEAFELEKCLIKKYGRRDLNTGTLINHTYGGEGPSGRIVTEELRQAVSKAQKALGDKHHTKTVEFRSTVAERLKPHLNSVETLSKRKATLQSPEHRAKMKLLMKGKNIGDSNPSKTPEARAKISAAKKKYWEARRNAA